MAVAEWLEDPYEFEGVGADPRNPRYYPVDEDEDQRVQTLAVREATRFFRPAERAPLPLGAFDTQSLAGTMTDAYVRRLDGHDGSHYQIEAGPVDWDLLDLNVWWVAWKATQSTKYVDPTFPVFRIQSRRRRFRHRLPYGWLSSTTDPVQQGAHFIASVGEMNAGETGMLDAEESGITEAKCLGWLETVEQHYRRPQVVYTGLYVAGGTIWRSERIREGKFGLRPMVLAAYIARESLLSRMKTQGVLHLPMHAWQYSSNGPVPGITGRADMDTIVDRDIFDRATRSEQRVVVVTPPTPEPTPVPQEEDDMKLRIIADDSDHQSPYRWVTDGLVRVQPGEQSIDWLVRTGQIEPGQTIQSPEWVHPLTIEQIPLYPPHEAQAPPAGAECRFRETAFPKYGPVS